MDNESDIIRIKLLMEKVLQEEILQMTQKSEAALRAEYPALQEAWENYQVMLRLIRAGELTK